MKKSGLLCYLFGRNRNLFVRCIFAKYCEEKQIKPGLRQGLRGGKQGKIKKIKNKRKHQRFFQVGFACCFQWL